MAKIENTKVYPTVTPAADDLLIATDVSDNNKTVTFLVSDLSGGAGILQGLQSVLDVDEVATQNILLTGNIDALGGYMNTDQYQISGSPGNVGQVLTSGGPGNATWQTPSGGSPQDIQTTLGIGDTTTLSMIMNGAGQQLSLSNGTDFNISGAASQINVGAGSDVILSATSTLQFIDGATITDYADNTGTAGQLLTINSAGTGLEWSTGVPGTAVPPLQQVLDVGHIAFNGPGISMTNSSPLVLDTTSNINSSGTNTYDGLNVFNANPASAPGAEVPIIEFGQGAYIRDSNGVIGVGKQLLTPNNPDLTSSVTGLFWTLYEDVLNQTLWTTLDFGNYAVQDMWLWGELHLNDPNDVTDGELHLGGNVPIWAGLAGSASFGIPGQFLTATATGVEWTTGGGGGTTQNLSQVLAVGNTADNNIILTDSGGLGATGNINCVQITPTNIIASNGIGGAGQILSVLASGEIEWITNTATGMTNWTFQGETGPNQSITQAATVQFLGDSLVISTASSALDTLTVTHSLFGTPGTYTYPSSIETNSTGHIISITSGSAPVVRTYTLTSQPNGLNTELDLTDSLGNVTTVTLVPLSGITINPVGGNTIEFSASAAAGMTSFDISADSGSAQTVTNGITYLFEGGTYITTSQAGGTPNTLTLNHDATTRTDTTSAASPVFGGTFTVIDSVTSVSTEGHVSAVNLKTITLPSSSGVTSITVSDGLSSSPNPIINTGNIQVDYLTTDNVVLSSTAWSYPPGPDDLDTLLINDATTDTVKHISIADLFSGLGGGTVTSFSASTTGNALVENVTNPTTTPDLALTWGGTALQYVNGAGNLVDISTLDNTTYDLTVPLGTTNIRLAGSDATNDDVTITGGANVTVTRISATELSIEAAASPGLTSFTLDGDSGPQQLVNNIDDEVTIEGGTVISSVASATNTITLNHDSVSRTDVPTTLTPSAGSIIPIVTAITSSVQGHIEAAAITTITWPSFVTSVGLDYLTTGGTAVAGAAAFTVANSPIGGAGNLQLIGDGTSLQYVTGEGKLETFPAIPVIPVYTLDTTQNGPVQVDIDLDLNGVSASQISLVGGTGITSITDSAGVITIVASGTGTVTNFTASVGGNALTETVTTSTTTPDLALTWAGLSTQYINGQGFLVAFPTIPDPNEYTISTAASGVTDIADIDLTHSGPGSGISSQFELEAGANMSLSVAGNKITLTANATTGITSIYLNGDSGPQQLVDTADDDLTIEGGTVISSVASATNTITLNHDAVSRTDTTAGTVAPGHGGTVNVITAFTSTTEGHVDTVTTTPIEWPAVGGTVTDVDYYYLSGGGTGVAGDDAFIASVTNSTTTPILYLASQGTALQYIDGSGVLKDFPTIDNTTYTYDALQAGFNVDLQLTSVPGAVVQEVKLIAGGGITLSTGATTNEVTIASINTGTVTNFSMTYSDAGGNASPGDPAFVIGISNPTTTPVVTFTGDGKTSQYIDGTGSLQAFPAIDNTTYDLTTTAGATNFANINLVPSSGVTDVVQLEAGNNLSLSVDAATGIITLDAAASSGLTSFTIDGTGAGSVVQTVDNSAAFITYNGNGTLIDCTVKAPNQVNVAHAAVTTNSAATSSSPGHGSSLPLLSDITMDGYGHVIEIKTNTVTWPAASGQVDSVGFNYTTPGPGTGAIGDPAFIATVGGTAINPVLDLEAQGKPISQFINGAGELEGMPSIPTQWGPFTTSGDVVTTPAWSTGANDVLEIVGLATSGGAGTVTGAVINTKFEVALINNGGTPDATTFYRGDGQWAVPGSYTLTGGPTNTNNSNSFLILESNGVFASAQRIMGAGGTLVSYDTTLGTYTIDSSTGAATNFYVTGSTGTTVNITSADTLGLLSGTGISTLSDAALDSVTITNTGVTSIIPGGGITVSSSTGAVTLSTTSAKSAGIFCGRNFMLNGKILDGVTPSTTLVNQKFCYRPMLWTYPTGGSLATSYPGPVDDMTWPIDINNAYAGLESAVNAPIFVTPYNATWEVELKAMKVTMSGDMCTLTSIDIGLYKGKNCSTGALHLTKVARCSLAPISDRIAYCCYADLSLVPGADLKLKEEEAYFIEMEWVGSVTASSCANNYFPFIAGRVDLHME